MIIDMPTSATALAGMEMSKQFEKIMIVTDAASSDITGKSCSPYTLHWTYDTYANAHTVGSAIVKNGGDTWFFITADYVFGHSIERDTGDVVRAAGGKVLGSARHPLNTPDFSSFLLQAQSSKAKIVGLANGGGDTINAIKQAAEFGIVAGGQNLAGIVMFISDIHSLGLKLAQGLIITEAYYWDLNDRTRAFGKRFFERMKRMPTMNQAATYSATLHYLNAVKAAGTKETKPVLAKMRATPVRDAFTDNGVVRRGRPHGAFDVPVRGQETRGIEGAVGLLQGARRGTRRPGIPAAQGRWLPADQVTENDHGRGPGPRPRHSNCWLKAGRSGRARTCDPRFWRPVLYQLSYTPAGNRRRRRFAPFQAQGMAGLQGRSGEPSVHCKTSAPDFSHHSKITSLPALRRKNQEPGRDHERSNRHQALRHPDHPVPPARQTRIDRTVGARGCRHCPTPSSARSTREPRPASRCWWRGAARSAGSTRSAGRARPPRRR